MILYVSIDAIRRETVKGEESPAIQMGYATRYGRLVAAKGRDTVRIRIRRQYDTGTGVMIGEAYGTIG
jgi:hypothetical protein